MSTALGVKSERPLPETFLENLQMHHGWNMSSAHQFLYRWWSMKDNQRDSHNHKFGIKSVNCGKPTRQDIHDIHIYLCLSRHTLDESFFESPAIMEFVFFLNLGNLFYILKTVLLFGLLHVENKV